MLDPDSDSQHGGGQSTDSGSNFENNGETQAYLDAIESVSVVESGDDLSGYDGLVTFIYSESFLDADLDWIHSIQAGVDRFPFEALRENNIRLTNSTGVHGDSVGETVVGYMLQFARLLHHHRDREARKGWKYPDWDEAFTLEGKSLCVIGLGTLGKGIATRADALGMDVVGVRRTPLPVEHVETVYLTNEIQQAVANVDFVAVATPLTDETEDLVSAEEFDAMETGTYLLDVSRGGVVDGTELLANLESGHLAGAALDVFETEPLPDESPFWEMDNVIVTPHASAANRDYVNRIEALVRENIIRLPTERTLANQVL